MTDIEVERKRFEEWAKSEGVWEDFGGRLSIQTQAMREAWLARARLDGGSVSSEALNGLCDEWENVRVPRSADSYELGNFDGYRGAMRDLRDLVERAKSTKGDS